MKFRQIFLLLLPALFSLHTSHVLAQANTESADSVYFDLSTPHHSVVTHLINLQENSFYPAVAARALNAPQLDEEEKISLAIRLKQIYDGMGRYIDPEQISKDANFQDSSRSNLPQYTVLRDQPRIYLEKIGEEWLYSAETVAAIEAIHAQVYPLGTSRLLEFSNQLTKGQSRTWLGLHLWQWSGILILLLCSFIAHRILTFLSVGLIGQVLTRMGYQKIADRLLVPVARPFSIFLVAIIIQIFIPPLQLPIQISQYIMAAFRVVVPFYGMMMLYRLTDVLSHYLTVLTARTENTLDDQLVPIIRRSVKILVILGGVIFILQNLDFNITGLLAGLSIGGLAFALAAQDTIKNLFGSFMIFVDRPFQVGDWIVTSGVDGIVEEVGFRSTRVRTFQSSLVYIPNGNLADMTVDNMGMRQYRRFLMDIAITYDTPAYLIEMFIEEMREIVRAHPDTRKDFIEIHLNSFGNSSLNIIFHTFLIVPDRPAELRARHQILLSIIRLAERLNVRFAFPTTTLHMETFPGKPTLTPSYPPDTPEGQAAYRLQVNSGRGQVQSPESGKL